MKISLKQDYVMPDVTLLGTFETITEGAFDGSKLDAAFPTGTPKPALTFS